MNIIDIPCRYCRVQPGEPCRTKKGRKYPRLHVKRHDLARWVNDGTIARLLRKAGKVA